MTTSLVLTTDFGFWDQIASYITLQVEKYAVDLLVLKQKSTAAYCRVGLDGQQNSCGLPSSVFTMRRTWVAALALLLGQVRLAIALDPVTRLDQYVRATWTVDRGLPQSTVLAVTQTRDGYLWIATQEGFVRFDGYEFVTYDKHSYPQIVSNMGVSMRAAQDGTLYIGTVDGGLIRMRGEQIDVLTEAHGLPSNNITTLHESRDGSLWIGTGAGLARLSDGRVTTIPSVQLPDKTITALAEDSAGQLWVATAGGLAMIKNGVIGHRVAAEGFPSHVVQSLAAGSDGSIWMGTDGEGLFQYRSGHIRRYGKSTGLPSLRISALYEDRNGTIWIGTPDAGFGRLHDGRAEFDSDKRDPVTTLFEDREGNLWVGRIGGLDQLADGIVITFSKEQGLSDDDIKSVTAGRDGTIWIATRSGVSDLAGTRRYSQRHGLPSSSILSISAARDGSLWVGTAGAGLTHIQGNRTTTYRKKDGLPSNAILALFEDRLGVMWVGTNAGLTRIVDGTIDPDEKLRRFPLESVSAITESRDGSIWIGMHERGAVRIQRNGTLESFTTQNGLSSNLVLAVREDSTGAIWIGTMGGGLNRYKNGKVSAITSRHGLADDSVFAILEDAHGNLWMSSNKGIFRANLAEMNAVADGRRSPFLSVLYGQSDGMKSRECNGGTQPVAWRAPDGKLWFATAGGVSALDPENALLGARVGPVHIAHIDVDQRKLAPGGHVPPGHRTLEFHYTSPSFKTPDKLRFRYKLDGFDADWTDAHTRRIAYYTNVPPGSYQFHVRVVNREGVASPPATAALVVEPFFYQTPVFWGLVAVSLLGAAWAAHQWRVRLVRASAERFKVLFDRNLAGVYRARIDGRILDCNDACLRILGLTSLEDLNERTIFDFYATPSDADELIRRVHSDGAVSSVETCLRRADGTPIWVLQNVSLGSSHQGKEILEATLIDLTERKHAEERIRYQAYHDALTDLPNRTLFKEQLSLAVAHAERRHRQVAVLFLDLDRFKLINDTLGHTIGDHLLQGMGERLKNCVRDEDSVARVGGDEFAILLMDLARPADAMVVAQKILDVVARPITVDGHELYTTCSIGISMSPADGVDAETLLKNADNALYRAKEAGKNNYQLCTPSMTQLAAERLAVENALRQAIDRNEFLVLYQPQYDLAMRKLIAVEALLRWDRPGIGIVGPAEFIATAEESRLIMPIGELVLDTALQQAKVWGDEFPIRIAVNVSAAQFRQRYLVRTIRTVLEEHSVDPTRLEIEITESTAMQNPTITAEILQELKKLGVSIVIDDFGIGHSSLNYLKRFPIDGLKIDRTFVQDMVSDASDAGIVSAIIAMAHALDLRVTAEGVETEEQLRFLEARGCSSVQGYLVGRPGSAEAITKVLQSGGTVAVPSASASLWLA
jgi:diguanylate cyclase (GGDEF)-like protein/PAS domain S-box-containing protein